MNRIRQAKENGALAHIDTMRREKKVVVWFFGFNFNLLNNSMSLQFHGWHHDTNYLDFHDMNHHHDRHRLYLKTKLFENLYFEFFSHQLTTKTTTSAVIPTIITTWIKILMIIIIIPIISTTTITLKKQKRLVTSTQS